MHERQPRQLNAGRHGGESRSGPAEGAGPERATRKERGRGPMETLGGDWEELVGAALLGTERRQGSPEALLDAAAVQTVRRRAGLRPAEAGPRPEPAPRDPRPVPPEAARRRLAQLLAGRSA
ncbi:hypothetical protein ACFWAP_34070, partial [Streptomyces goshikiensis]